MLKNQGQKALINHHLHPHHWFFCGEKTWNSLNPLVFRNHPSFFETLTYCTDGGIHWAASSISCLDDFVTDVQVETEVLLCRFSIHHLPVLTDVWLWCSRDTKEGEASAINVQSQQHGKQAILSNYDNNWRLSSRQILTFKLTRVFCKGWKVVVFVTIGDSTQQILLLLDAGEGRLPVKIISAVCLPWENWSPSPTVSCRKMRQTVNYGWTVTWLQLSNNSENKGVKMHKSLSYLMSNWI